MRIAPPYAADGSGKRYDAKLSIEGCAFDTDPSAPYDRAVTPPDASVCTVHVSWSGASCPLAVDPSWGTTGAMTVQRNAHTASILPNDKVLIVGGIAGLTALAAAETYDPVTGTWSATGSMTGARRLHHAVVLGSGKVLVAAGVNANNNLVKPSEIYDATTGTSAEVYEPATGTWTATSAMGALHAGHAAVVLATGKVLVAGGGDEATTGVLSSSELSDPVAGTRAPTTGAMSAKRYFHTASILANGRVLVVGGLVSASAATMSAEVYDPIAGMWTVTGSPTAGYAGAHTASVLSGDKVLVVGGSRTAPSTLVDLYNAATGAWTAPGPLAPGPREHFDGRGCERLLACAPYLGRHFRRAVFSG